MKPLSKLHAEAVAKAKTDDEKVKAAAVAMIEKPMDMIRAILLKHEQAVIEVMRELHEAKEVAVREEREARIDVLMRLHEMQGEQSHNYYHYAANQIREMGKENT